MFIEFMDPVVIDDISTRDRTKIRVGERGTAGRFWANLTFYSRSDAIRFAENLLILAKDSSLKETEISSNRHTFS